MPVEAITDFSAATGGAPGDVACLGAVCPVEHDRPLIQQLDTEPSRSIHCSGSMRPRSKPVDERERGADEIAWAAAEFAGNNQPARRNRRAKKPSLRPSPSRRRRAGSLIGWRV